VSALASDVFVLPLLHTLAFHVWTVAGGKCGERLRVSAETSTANTGQESCGRVSDVLFGWGIRAHILLSTETISRVASVAALAEARRRRENQNVRMPDYGVLCRMRFGGLRAGG
jgi:hypothetical protein